MVLSINSGNQQILSPRPHVTIHLTLALKSQLYTGLLS